MWLGKDHPIFDMVSHLNRQRAFSAKTFGPGDRRKGVCDHIRKEIAEIEAEPSNIYEYADVILLACDLAWRAGFSSEMICDALAEKLTKNENRTWPDWRTQSPDHAIEHVR